MVVFGATSSATDAVVVIATALGSTTVTLSVEPVVTLVVMAAVTLLADSIVAMSEAVKLLCGNACRPADSVLSEDSLRLAYSGSTRKPGYEQGSARLGD